MAKRTGLVSMSVDALLKVREDIGNTLSRRADEMKKQLSRLGGEVARGRGKSLKGRKVPVRYRDKSGNTWAGRGAQPVWLREKIKAGGKLEDFAVKQNSRCSQGLKQKVQEASSIQEGGRSDWGTTVI